MTLVNRLRLFFKTRVSGYMTRDGRWVDIHFDKRPSAKPTLSHARPSGASDEGAKDPSTDRGRSQINLLSILDLPDRKRKLIKKPGGDSVRPETDIPVSTEESEEYKKERQSGLDYSRTLEKVLKGVPKFGAQEDWTPSQRKKANEAALEILSKVDGVTGKDNKNLTVEEQRKRLERLAKSGDVPKNWRDKLAAYSGQGGIGDSLNEYYTPPDVAAAMWAVLSRMGLSEGHVLEPSAGSGVFQETKPQGITMTAVEWDKTSSSINALLHQPDNQLHTEFLDQPVAVIHRLRKIVTRVYMNKGKRNLRRIKRFARQVRQCYRILPSRKQQCRMFKLCHHLANNKNRLGFQFFKMT